MRKLGRILKNALHCPKRDPESLEITREPHFLFIVTPPYSGSTALAALIETSPFVTGLDERAEGQWLIPELSSDDRWDENLQVDFAAVRAVWMARFGALQSRAPKLRVVVEKSPPNMVRIAGLLSQFENHSLLANNRNPYASIPSLARRLVAPDASTQVWLGALTRLAHEWVGRSSLIKTLVEQHDINLITYEQFCAKPAILHQKLDLPAEILNSMSFDQLLSIKGRPPAALTNFNDRQISALSDSEIDAITHGLRAHDELLRYFGYGLL